MSRTSFIYAILAVGALIGGPGAVEAQRPYSNSSAYRPTRPALSPYLQLFRSDPGQILPSYQNFVQPQVEARNFRRRQEGRVQNLQQGLQRVETSQRMQLQNTGGAIQSGIGSGFQTSRQYFGSHASYFRTHRAQAGGGGSLLGTQRPTTMTPRRTGLTSGRSAPTASRYVDQAIRGR